MDRDTLVLSLTNYAYAYARRHAHRKACHLKGQVEDLAQYLLLQVLLRAGEYDPAKSKPSTWACNLFGFVVMRFQPHPNTSIQTKVADMDTYAAPHPQDFSEEEGNLPIKVQMAAEPESLRFLLDCFGMDTDAVAEKWGYSRQKVHRKKSQTLRRVRCYLEKWK